MEKSDEKTDAHAAFKHSGGGVNAEGKPIVCNTTTRPDQYQMPIDEGRG
jgi:hypothetical protein